MKRTFISGLVAFLVLLQGQAQAAGTLSNQAAYNAVWQFFKGHADGVVVTGVLEIPQQNSAQVDIQITGWLLARPKNDPITAYALGPGGGTFEWTGAGKAIFVHYNDGRWVFRQLITPQGTWSNLSYAANP
jgi:hypothetical protein